MLKSKWNKVISLALVIALLVMIVPASALAASPATPKITDVRQAVQLIQSSYLGVHSNGTSYIKAGAANYIDPKVLAEITKGMNSVNKEILAGALVRNKTTNAITAAKNTSGITPDVVLYGTITYTWYGFTFDINAYYSGLLAIDLQNDENILIDGGAVALIAGGAPVALAAGIGAIVYSQWVTAAQEGQYTGNGCTEYFFGTTSSPFLFNVITNS